MMTRDATLRSFAVARPTRADLDAARTRTVPDLLAPDLRVLFVGINPGLYSAAVGHHFGRPGNRFWPALHRAGFTPRLLSPFEERELLAHGIGITNVVARTTASAAELTPDELRRGARRLARKVALHRPAFVAFLGLGAYRTALAKPAARIGPQPDLFAGARVWLLPNPSGLNAHHQLPDLARRFAALRRAAGLPDRRR